jgi:dienelactone hydrolase
MMDADAIADFIKADPRINKNKVFAHGRSLGGAVATHLAAKQSRAGEPLFKGVIVESTFTCISDMAD